MAKGEIAFWRVLEIQPTMDKGAIKRAYRKKARLLHPDVNKDPDSQTRFATLNTAYETAMAWAKSQRSQSEAADWEPSLGDALGGLQFTREPVVRPHPSPPPPPTPFDAPPPASGASAFQTPVAGFEEQLSGLFGTEADPQPAPTDAQPATVGADLFTDVTISFEEAFAGTTQTIKVHPSGPCSTCKGTRVVRDPCEICAGSGTIDGRSQCWNCYGRGYTRQRACPTCSGSGEVQTTESLRVPIPAGTRSNTVLRIKGRGHHGGAGRGSLRVRVMVTESQTFKFGPGGSLLLELGVDVATAGLGGIKSIPLPDGSTMDLTIPAMAGDKREIIVPGKGWPSKSGAGDLRVKLNVGFPSEITQRMRDALKSYRQAADEVQD